jgi:hypothetical protein
MIKKTVPVVRLCRQERSRLEAPDQGGNQAGRPEGYNPVHPACPYGGRCETHGSQMESSPLLQSLKRLVGLPACFPPFPPASRVFGPAGSLCEDEGVDTKWRSDVQFQPALPLPTTLRRVGRPTLLL